MIFRTRVLLKLSFVFLISIGVSSVTLLEKGYADPTHFAPIPGSNGLDSVTPEPVIPEEVGSDIGQNSSAPAIPNGNMNSGISSMGSSFGGGQNNSAPAIPNGNMNTGVTPGGFNSDDMTPGGFNSNSTNSENTSQDMDSGV